MELKEIAAVSGKGGLFKIVKPTRTGVILESMDDAKQKIVAGQTSKVSILDEISIYTHSEDGTVALAEVFKKIYALFPKGLTIDGKADGADLHAFLLQVLPDYDSDRVYNSDIKKLVVWYGILLHHAPELLKPTEEAVEEAPKDKPAKKAKVKAEDEAKPEATEPKPAAAKKPAKAKLPK
jgi:hypothetical protein